MSHSKSNLCLQTHGHTYSTVSAATKLKFKSCGFACLPTCPAPSQSKKIKFSELGWDHLFYLDEEKKIITACRGLNLTLQWEPLICTFFADRKTPTASKIIQFPFSDTLRKTAYPAMPCWVSVWQNFSRPLYPRQDPYQSFSPPGFIRRHLFLHIRGPRQRGGGWELPITLFTMQIGCPYFQPFLQTRRH